MVAGKPGPVVPERYVKALAGQDPIESQRKAPKRIKKLLRGLSEKELARKPAPGKWSIKEVIAHLADGEVILGSRMRFVAAMDRPMIVGYDQDAFVERLGIDRVKTSALFDDFAAVRAANVALLKRLPEGAAQRVGLHTERGEETIETMLVMYAGHDRIHEEQIESIRAALRGKKKAAPSADAKPAKQAKKTQKASKSPKTPKVNGKKAKKRARADQLATAST